MFDSPLFWIFLIWWLLSAIAGNKKRKAKLQASRSAELVDEPDISLEVNSQHPDEQPLVAPQFIEDLGVPKQPLRPGAPPALGEIMRGLGLMPDKPIAPVMVPEVEELEPDPEPLEEVVEEVALEVSAVAPVKPATVHQSRDPLNRFACLPPLQRAIILKEVLDRPKALRRPGLF